MTSKEQICYLRNTANDEKIELPNNEEILLGRNKLTQITDSYVSKNHVSCTACFETYEVAVKWIGSNMSGINGYALKKGVTYKLTHGDRIELLLRKYIFEIVFEPFNFKLEASPAKEIANEEIENKSLDTTGNSKNKRIITDKDGKRIKNASIFDGPKAKQVCSEYNWKRLHNGMLHVMETRDYRFTKKVASFDLDGTIITTKSGLVFAKNITDWQFLYSDIPQKLRKLYEDNYQIVIFTNQAGIGRGTLLLTDFKTKLQNISEKLCVPMMAFVSTGKGQYRKPMIGMWEEFISINEDNQIDISKSFYVGDAAGREANWMPKAKKDHSISDRLFAKNIGIQFYTPEEYFLNQKPSKWKEPIFDPTKILNNSLTESNSEKLTSNDLEILILVGYPASGKSFICKEYLIPAGYVWVNRDTLKTTEKCLQLVEKSLREEKKVVIDNTNVDKKSRQQYIDMGNKMKIPVRCAIMNTSVQHCFHNNLFRQLTDTSHAIITPQVMNSLKSKYEEPKLNEGFKSVFKVNCIPKFSDDKLKKLYQMYLLDK